MPLRLIYNISFILIIFVLVYSSVFLIKNKKIDEKSLVFSFPKCILFLSIVFNLKIFVSVFLFDIPKIGNLEQNILRQGLLSIFPFIKFFIIIFINSILLCIFVNNKMNIKLYELPTYILGVIAIETFFTIYMYSYKGILGVRYGMLLFHVFFIFYSIYLIKRNKVSEIRIVLSKIDLLLIFFSIGLFMMIYIPFGIYNQFSDNAIIINGLISIIKKDSLIPYYTTNEYYSPIGAFFSLIFEYITQNNNILTSSTIPFLISYITLPFITYQFLKNFITDDTSIAILGTIITILMDGLAIVLIPLYKNNLTNFVIEWQISPATNSLYFSTISWIWLTPYKTLGMSFASGTFNIINRKKIIGLIFGGAFIAFSFINPRQPFLSFLLLIFLLGTKKIKLKDLIILTLSIIMFLGPIFPIIVFKTIDNFVIYFCQSNLIIDYNLIQHIIFEISNNFTQYFHMIILMVSFILLLFILFKNNGSMKDLKKYDQEFSYRNIDMKINIFNKLVFRIDYMIFLGLSILLITYIVLNSYQYSYTSLINKNISITTIEYLIMRFHIIILLIIMGFLYLKSNNRIKIMICILLIFIYLGKNIKSNVGLNVPLIITLLAIPTINLLKKSKKKLLLIIFILYVFLGVFSSSLYSGTIKTNEIAFEYQDVPILVKILIDKKYNEYIYCPSTYCYYANRVVSMANLQLTSNPNATIYIIHKKYTDNSIIKNLLNNKKNNILFNGKAFILLEKIKNLY